MNGPNGARMALDEPPLACTVDAGVVAAAVRSAVEAGLESMSARCAFAEVAVARQSPNSKDRKNEFMAWKTSLGPVSGEARWASGEARSRLAGFCAPAR